jgi:cephalosporin hydroxylase
MIQELVWRVCPDVIIESGVAHSGSIEAHPMSRRIRLIEGGSVADSTFETVLGHIPPGASVMVALDSEHTRSHVEAELERYAPLVTGEGWFRDNPLEAIHTFLAAHRDVEVDPSLTRLDVTYCRSGFLRGLAPTRSRFTPGS